LKINGKMGFFLQKRSRKGWLRCQRLNSQLDKSVFWLGIRDKTPTYAHATIKKPFAFENVSLLYDGC
jgi:hypothetical protein